MVVLEKTEKRDQIREYFNRNIWTCDKVVILYIFKIYLKVLIMGFADR